ncbi:BgTH12-02953 [Blumeria graminis f. sp. triticale]|uniref:BgTH12-02953 n=1 Tax=Blumeria graminis f. sp. triticale TaxID=1689686 RepID=A0A9W4GFX4_BLUGR|nr:BgTH12-02953 [Blumeria graminis f. sp. triticale]
MKNSAIQQLEICVNSAVPLPNSCGNNMTCERQKSSFHQLCLSSDENLRNRTSYFAELQINIAEGTIEHWTTPRPVTTDKWIANTHWSYFHLDCVGNERKPPQEIADETCL